MRKKTCKAFVWYETKTRLLNLGNFHFVQYPKFLRKHKIVCSYGPGLGSSIFPRCNRISMEFIDNTRTYKINNFLFGAIWFCCADRERWIKMDFVWDVYKLRRRPVCLCVCVCVGGCSSPFSVFLGKQKIVVFGFREALICWGSMLDRLKMPKAAEATTTLLNHLRDSVLQLHRHWIWMRFLVCRTITFCWFPGNPEIRIINHQCYCRTNQVSVAHFQRNYSGSVISMQGASQEKQALERRTRRERMIDRESWKKMKKEKKWKKAKKNREKMKEWK